MQTRGSVARFARLAAFVACALLFGSCTWKPWIPGESGWNPEIVVDPARLPRPLALDSTLVDELSCYAPICDERFRVVVGESGILTVRAIFDLESQDQQARLVLEALSGVLGQAGSGRGPRVDVTPLVVRRPVDPGTYYVLLQSIGGGPAPYELIASLTPGAGPPPAPVAETARPTREGPPPRFTKVDLGANVGGGYDPEVHFASIRTFAFPALPRPGEAIPAGTRLRSPADRQLRRFLAEGLELKGLRQADGSETADIVVDFSTGETTRAYFPLTWLYDDYGFAEWGPGYQLNTRGKLILDIIDVRTDRIAWHAWTTFGLGPGVIHAEEAEPELRRAVADVLSRFPPF